MSVDTVANEYNMVVYFEIPETASVKALTYVVEDGLFYLVYDHSNS